MKWHLGTNYHNSRSYDDDPSSRVVVGQISLTIAWLAAEVRRRLDALKRPPTRGRGSQVILIEQGGPHRFTVLGSPIANHAVHESAISCPFPELDAAAARQRAKARASAGAPRHALGQPANDPSAAKNA
ncbi:MAG TPA: hypothetical protein VFP57_06550 [Sphingomicrobium sp.]|jgi:hypothetical protein|nr:hypothetical protein [Sphingomicrobium sp.]